MADPRPPIYATVEAHLGRIGSAEAVPLIIGVTERLPRSTWKSSALPGHQVAPLASVLRNVDELPADPFYLDPEMLNETGVGGYLAEVGDLLFVGEGHGTAHDWEKMSLEDKCNWIQAYEAP